MELWFTEHLSDHVRFSLRVTRHLYSAPSPYQQIDVFDSAEFGRVLVLDGYLMITERDEFIYHEMITHVPMAVHPNPRRVLVVGGGDGGTVRELCRYEHVEHIDLVEIDELVVQAAQDYFPTTSSGFTDPRVNLHFADGVDFVSKCSTKYDLIIVDSTDPVGPGEGLFTSGFYQNCFRILNSDGIMVNQHEGPFYQQDAWPVNSVLTPASWKSSPSPYRLHSHLCLGTLAVWLCLQAVPSAEDLRAEAWESLGLTTRYYKHRPPSRSICPACVCGRALTRWSKDPEQPAETAGFFDLGWRSLYLPALLACSAMVQSAGYPGELFGPKPTFALNFSSASPGVNLTVRK